MHIIRFLQIYNIYCIDKKTSNYFSNIYLCNSFPRELYFNSGHLNYYNSITLMRCPFYSIIKSLQRKNLLIFMFICVLTISLVAAQWNTKLLQGFSSIVLQGQDCACWFWREQKGTIWQGEELNFIAKWKLHFCDISSHDHIFVNEMPQTLLWSISVFINWHYFVFFFLSWSRK